MDNTGKLYFQAEDNLFSVQSTLAKNSFYCLNTVGLALPTLVLVDLHLYTVGVFS